MKSLKLFLWFIFLFFNIKLEAKTIYVDNSNISGYEDGSAQFPYNTIEEALAVAVNADTIKVAAGNYQDTSILIPQSVTIIGADQDSTFIEGKLVLSSKLPPAPVRIENLYCWNIQRGDSGLTRAPLTISNCSLQGLSDFIGYVDSTSIFRVLNTKVEGDISLVYSSCSGTIEISDCQSDSVYLDVRASGKNIWIKNNKVSGVLRILTRSQKDTIHVEGNEIKDSLVITSVSSNSNFVKGNTIGNSFRMFAVAQRGDFILNNKIIDGNFSNTFIAGTSVIDSNELLNGGMIINGVAADLVIIRNNINPPNTQTGIDFTSRSGGRIDSNTITLSYIPATGIPPEDDTMAVCGIRVKSRSFQGLSDNQIEGGCYGIYLNVVSSHETKGNSIENADRGIFFETVSGQLEDNTVQDCANDGMILRAHREYGDSNSILVSKNKILNNGGHGIRLKSNANLGYDTSGFNIIRGNAGYDLYLETPDTLFDTIYAQNNTWTNAIKGDIEQFDIYDQRDDTSLALVIFEPFITGVKEELPISTTDLQLFPNPFKSKFQMSYYLLKPGLVKIKVYNSQGRQIATVADERQASGQHDLTVDATSWNNGIYFCQVQVKSEQPTSGPDLIRTQKIILIK